MSILNYFYETLIETLAELGRSKASRRGRLFNIEDQKKRVRATLLPGIFFLLGNASGYLYHPYYFIPFFLFCLYKINHYFGYIKIK